MRVLVVEDDRVSAAFLKDTLTFFGYQVTTAVNGQEAFELLRSGEFRMVVSDWEMPEMNGDELCRQVRRRQWNSYIYMVLVTSFNEIDHIVEGLCRRRRPFEQTLSSRRTARAAPNRPAALCRSKVATAMLFTLAKLTESRDNGYRFAFRADEAKYCRILCRNFRRGTNLRI